MTPVTDAMLQHPADGDWLFWRRTYQNISFSPLKQIATTNVQGLGVAWTLTLPPSANETTPLVHDGVLFVESGASIQALSATTGEPLWQYTRSLPDGLPTAAKRASSTSEFTARHSTPSHPTGM